MSSILGQELSRIASSIKHSNNEDEMCDVVYKLLRQLRGNISEKDVIKAVGLTVDIFQTMHGDVSDQKAKNVMDYSRKRFLR